VSSYKAGLLSLFKTAAHLTCIKKSNSYLTENKHRLHDKDNLLMQFGGDISFFFPENRRKYIHYIVLTNAKLYCYGRWYM